MENAAGVRNDARNYQPMFLSQRKFERFFSLKRKQVFLMFFGTISFVERKFFKRVNRPQDRKILESPEIFYFAATSIHRKKHSSFENILDM